MTCWTPWRPTGDRFEAPPTAGCRGLAHSSRRYDMPSSRTDGVVAGPSPTSPPPAAAPAASPPVPAPSRQVPRLVRWVVWCAAGGIVIGAAYLGIRWWSYRLSHSITDDAFVEAHIINVAPEMVSGRVVRFL